MAQIIAAKKDNEPIRHARILWHIIRWKSIPVIVSLKSTWGQHLVFKPPYPPAPLCAQVLLSWEIDGAARTSEVVELKDERAHINHLHACSGNRCTVEIMPVARAGVIEFAGTVAHHSIFTVVGRISDWYYH